MLMLLVSRTNFAKLNFYLIIKKCSLSMAIVFLYRRIFTIFIKIKKKQKYKDKTYFWKIN